MTALQPAMFPDLATADFYRSDELDVVAEEVMRRHGHMGGLVRLMPVVEAIENGEIRVLFLMNGKPLAEADDPEAHDVAGKCIKAPAIWHDVTGYDIAIWIRDAIWTGLTGHARRAIVLHELLHVELIRDKDDQAKVAVRKHDVEDFVDVARHYGPIAGEGARYVRAAAAFAGQPEPMHPAKSASRTPEEIAADVETLPVGDQMAVHAAVKGVRALRDIAERSGTDITVTTSGPGLPERTATIHGRKVDPETGEILDTNDCERLVDGDDCVTHDATWPEVAKACWAVNPPPRKRAAS